MSLTRVGEHEFVWTCRFLSRGACLPRSEPLPNIPGSECDFLKLFLFRQFSAVCWIGDGGLSSDLSSCPAKSSEHIRKHVITNCSIALTVPTFLEVMWTVRRLLVSHSRSFKGLVSQSRFRKLFQDDEGSCMLL
jgi:hypothetical protein